MYLNVCNLGETSIDWLMTHVTWLFGLSTMSIYIKAENGKEQLKILEIWKSLSGKFKTLTPFFAEFHKWKYKRARVSN